jgi:YVTN family beta-propeller protein
MNNRITGRISFRSLLLLPLLIAGILTILASGSGGGSGGAESDCIVICEPLSPATYRAYINNMNDGTISVVDFTSSSLVSLTDPTVTVVGAFPKGGMGAGGILKISSLSPKLYVVNADSNTVSVIDKTTRTVMTTIPVGNNPLGIARGPLGFEEVYVANRDDDTVSVIDPTTDSVTATIAVGDGPYAFAVGINTLYVANEAPSTPGMGTVSVIDLNTRTVTATVAVAVRHMASLSIATPFMCPTPLLAYPLSILRRTRSRRLSQLWEACKTLSP